MTFYEQLNDQDQPKLNPPMRYSILHVDHDVYSIIHGCLNFRYTISQGGLRRKLHVPDNPVI